MRGKREIPRLDTLAAFLSPVQSRDEDGQLVQGWQTEFEAWANVKYLRGGEAVMQARMQSHTPAIVTVRASSNSRRITAEWRVTVAGRVFEVKEPPRPTPDRAWFEMLVEGQ